MTSSKTLEYYNQNATTFSESTLNVDFESTQEKFLSNLKDGASILDFGCGSGRDTKYFLRKGYQVEAIDGSEELCKIASRNTGIIVKHQLFNELDEFNKYDGIWACSSILHLSKNELKPVIYKMLRALKAEGIIYTSFKLGDFEGERNGRYFTDFTLESFSDFVSDINGIEIVEYWITSDVRPGRNEKWLNVLLKKV